MITIIIACTQIVLMAVIPVNLGELVAHMLGFTFSASIMTLEGVEPSQFTSANYVSEINVFNEL